jgi:hypothetical protein
MRNWGFKLTCLSWALLGEHGVGTSARVKRRRRRPAAARGRAAGHRGQGCRPPGARLPVEITSCLRLSARPPAVAGAAASHTCRSAPLGLWRCACGQVPVAFGVAREDARERAGRPEAAAPRRQRLLGAWAEGLLGAWAEGLLGHYYRGYNCLLGHA